jgi:CBS domain-containing protein
MATRPSLQSSPHLHHGHERHHHGLLTHHRFSGALISVAGLIGRPVRNQAGAEVGKMTDIVARWDGGPYPPATGLVVKVGRRPAFLQISQVDTISATEVRLASARLDLRDFERRPGEVVLAGDVLDRQLVDVDGVRVVRASDLYVARVGLAWRLVGVDVSLQSLLRRLGPARWRARATPDRVVDWAAIQPFGSHPGAVRLTRSNHALHRLRPAEMADLLEELGRRERQELLAALDTGLAADALEEMQPEELEQLLRDAPVDQAAALVAAMEPDEAADALRDLEPEEREGILDAMEPDTAGELAALLTFPERSAGGLMTTHLVEVEATELVGAVRTRLREESEHRADIDRVVVVDHDGALLDNLSLFALLIADDDMAVADLIAEQPPVTVETDASLDDVVDALVESRASSVVVVDDEAHPIGRILADDVVDALVPEHGHTRFPRILAS